MVTRSVVRGVTRDVTFGITGTVASADVGLEYTGQVATRSFFPSNLTGSQVESMARTYHYARDDITSLQLVFVDAYGDNEAASGATTTIEASIEYPEGTMTRVQFSAADAGSLASGETLVSDATSVTIPNGAKFFTRVYRENANGFIYNLYSPFDSANGDRIEVGGTGTVTNAVMSGTITSNASVLGPPQAIIATTQKASVLLVGDSRMIGVGDDVSANGGDSGEVSKSIQEYAYINCGIAGGKVSQFLTTPSKRVALGQYCSHVVHQYGINDVDSGSTEATITEDLRLAYGILKNGKDGIFQTTLPPWTTSTDGWTTTVNQTPFTDETVRVSMNTFIRNEPDILTGYFEVANSVESAEDSGLWKPNYTDDGVHENATGYSQIVTDEAIDAALFTRYAETAAMTAAEKYFLRWNTPPVSAAESAITTFIASLTSAGIWSKLDILYITAGPDSQAARINLINPAYFELSNHDAPTFAAYDGFTNNGAGFGVCTNWNPTRDAVNYVQDSACIFIWSNDNSNTNTTLCGYNSGGVKAYIAPRNAGNTIGNSLNDSTLTNSFTSTDSLGLHLLTRTASTGYDIYVLGTNKGTVSKASTGIPNNEIWLGSGLLFPDATHTFSIFGAGAGLSSTEAGNLNTACETLMTALGAI